MKSLALAAVAVTALGLAGCGFSGPPANVAPVTTSSVADTTYVESGIVTYVEVHTPDGSVPCLVLDPYDRGPTSLDCDWTVIR